MRGILKVNCLGGVMISINKFVYRILFLLSLIAILYATLYRETGHGNMELHLFWTIKRAWREHSGYHWYLILGNIALFIPFGFFLTPILFKPDWRKVVILGIALSTVIEIIQVLTNRGLGELDDVLHNTWGSLLGYCAAVIMEHVLGRRNKQFKGQLMGSILFLGFTITMFTLLILYNRPG
ncbi:VanZ family protein [Enterocloster bolteae]|uniref:VanZ family protein n=1 Tax=Enterocloster bolteae TaxID=208479 RepID=UPI002A82DC2E|nr:VanZ family protein [Enterocloster bolteae]